MGTRNLDLTVLSTEISIHTSVSASFSQSLQTKTREAERWLAERTNESER